MAVAAIIFLIVFIVAAILLYRELNPEKIVPYSPTGPTGPKGMPGPRFAATELEMIMNIIIDLEKADYYGERGNFVDGENPTTAVDSFALSAAIRALKNYEALLSQPIYQLIPPGFFDIDRPAKTLKSVR